MRFLTLVVSILTLYPSLAFAQETSYLSIPSSAFTPVSIYSLQDSSVDHYGGNVSGTARLFDYSTLMFAPVALPHGAMVTGFRCGARVAEKDRKIIFTLRRNEPQQANVDIATVMTTVEGVGFEHRNTNRVTSPVIDNNIFNYYIVAKIEPPGGRAPCLICAIGYCSIRYEVGPQVDTRENLTKE